MFNIDNPQSSHKSERYYIGINAPLTTQVAFNDVNNISCESVNTFLNKFGWIDDDVDYRCIGVNKREKRDDLRVTLRLSFNIPYLKDEKLHHSIMPEGKTLDLEHHRIDTNCVFQKGEEPFMEARIDYGASYLSIKRYYETNTTFREIAETGGENGQNVIHDKFRNVHDEMHIQNQHISNFWDDSYQKVWNQYCAIKKDSYSFCDIM
jgi:hypothetical protein